MNRRTFLTALTSLPALAAPPRFIKSICSIIFPNELSYPEKFRQAREAGFSGIEMRLGEEIPMEMSQDEVKRIGECLPVRLVRRPPGEMFDAFFGERPVRIVTQLFPPDTHHREPVRQESVDVQVVQRGQ